MLFTYDIQQGIKPVSANTQTKFEQISKEIEELYLPKYLGRSFAYAVQKTPDNFTSLLEGIEFKDCDGDDIKFLGLNYVFAYLIYAEYAWLIKFADTYTGQVIKTRNEAETITQGQESQLKNKYRKIAEDQVEVMKLYLNENTDTYKLWNCAKTKKAFTPKLTGLKRT